MRFSTFGLLTGSLWLGVLVGAQAAAAFEEGANEYEKLKACEKQLCTILVKKETAGQVFACGLSKTWTKDKIKEGVEKKKLTWSLGDARCSLDLAMPRANLVDAVSKPSYTLAFPEHTVKCEVEREKEVTPINIKLAPKIEFKDGKAVKAFLGLKDIEAPAVVKGAVWTVATVEDNVGLFHGDIIKEVNTFIGPKCEESVAGK